MAYTTNYGNQILTYDYLQAATSQGFSKLNYELFPKGIYKGLSLEYVDANTVRISPGVTFYWDSTTEVGSRIETQDYISIAVTGAVDVSQPFIILRFDWVNQTNNYMGWEKVALADILTDDIVVGRLEFTTGNVLLNSFDETRRMESHLKELTEDQDLLKVYPTETTPTNQFVVASGIVDTYKGAQTVSGGTYPVGGVSATGGSARNDIIYIDEDGVPQVEENFISYGSRKVIAEIRRASGRSDIRGSEIFLIDRDRNAPREYITTLDVIDKFITVNSEETGSGVQGTGLAGLEVERGTATNFRLEFDESDNSWRTGLTGSTKKLANIIDNPNNEAVPSWDQSNGQLETGNYLKMDPARQNYYNYNPGDVNSYSKYGWLSNVARIGFGGSGTGYQNGLVITDSLDAQLAKFYNNGGFQSRSFTAQKAGNNTGAPQWYKLCTITATNADRIVLEGLGASGIAYNNVDHVGRCSIVISIQNGVADTEANVQGYFYNEGGDRLVTNVKCEENGGNFIIDVFVELGTFSLDGWYAYCRAQTTAITWSLTSDSDPGTGTGIRQLTDKFQINTETVTFKGSTPAVEIDGSLDDPTLRFKEAGTARSTIRHDLSENAMVFASTQEDGSGYEFKFEGDIEATTINLTSSEEFKENIHICNLSALNILSEINIVNYNYKQGLTKNPNQQMVGFIAEDTNPLLSGDSQKEMIANNCIGLLIKAVQELKKENENLRELIDSKANKEISYGGY